MELIAVPDLRRPLRGGGLTMYHPHERRGPFVLLPSRLDVAGARNGTPDFLLELVRGQDPTLPPEPHGILDFRLEAVYDSDAALATLRAIEPRATIEPAVFSAGFVRLVVATDVAEVPNDLEAPMPLAWNALGTARARHRLGADGATLVKGALAGGVLPLTAVAAMEFTGVASRVPIGVAFDPRALIAALTDGRPDAVVTYTSVLEFFQRDVSRLPLQLLGDLPDSERADFAETMADRVRLHFGGFVAPLGREQQSCIALPRPDAVAPGRVEWNLAEAVVVPRACVLALDPLAAARALVRERGIAAVVADTVVPALRTGVVEVSVTANLPANRADVLAIGATLTAPPRLPLRPQASIATTEFVAPRDADRVRLRLSPSEPAEYEYSTFAVVSDDVGTRRLEHGPTKHAGLRLALDVTDFPVRFVPLEISPALAAIASVEIECRYWVGGEAMARRATLDRAVPALTLALPLDATDASIAGCAVATDGSGRVPFGSLAAAALRLDLASFAEFGPHSIRIRCHVTPPTALAAIDVRPEAAPDTPGDVSVLRFTPTEQEREWSWFAAVPFRAGYCWRWHSATGTPAEWSEPRSPFEPLDVEAGAS